MTHTAKPRLVVVPSDPISAYEQKGLDWLERYYNPMSMFGEVFALSPLEDGERYAYGMTIIGVAERDFLKMLRKLRPNVVRGYGGYWASDLVCSHRVPNIPVVVSVHDPNPDNMHRSIRYADLIICMSDIVARTVVDRGADPNRVRIIPNRVDRKVFHPIEDTALFRSLSGRFPDGKHILHIGRKSKEKNIETLISSLPLLPKEYHCIFVGQGDAEPYKSLAITLNVNDRCFWIDSVKNSELPLWYSWCDCMCVPSLWEGFGVVFIEAAACAAPIVTSDIEPMNEYLTNNVSACLVGEYQNPDALATAIRRVCEDDGYRNTISAGAIKVAESFDRHVVDRREVSIYHEAMNSGPPSLSRRREIAVWKAQKRIMSLARKGSPKRILRAVVNRTSSMKNILCHNLKPNVIKLKYLVLGAKIGRNQWDGHKSLKTYEDLMAWSWEEIQKNASNYFRRLNFSISKVRGKVLEIGCGIGTMTRWIAASREVEHIWAIDFSAEAIEKLIGHNLPKVTPLKMSVESLVFEPEIIFDTVMICEVMEHIYPDEEKRMRNTLRKVVNSKTRYVISVPIGWLPDQYHVRSYSKKGFIRHLRKFYGEPVEVDYSSGYSQVAWGYFKASRQ